jgi:hypothetical protein
MVSSPLLRSAKFANVQHVRSAQSAMTEVAIAEPANHVVNIVSLIVVAAPFLPIANF